MEPSDYQMLTRLILGVSDCAMKVEGLSGKATVNL